MQTGRKRLAFACMMLCGAGQGAWACLPEIKQLSEGAFSPSAVSQLWPGASCGTFLSETGAEGAFCSWKYGYRSEASETSFTSMTEALSDCFALLPAAQGEDGVNHPDSYDLQRLDAGPVVVSTALKDKAGQGATYVFLRLDPRVRAH